MPRGLFAQTSVKLGFRAKTIRKLNSHFFAMQALTARLVGSCPKKRETACESGPAAPPGEGGWEALRGPKSRVLVRIEEAIASSLPFFEGGAEFPLMPATV